MRNVRTQCVRLATLLTTLAATAVPAWADINVGDTIPDLQVDKWYNLPKGKSAVSREDLRGKIVVVEFWATWCGPCRETIPHLAELQKKHKNKGVIILGISNEPEGTVKSFLDKNKHMDYVVAAGGEDLREKFGVNSFPTAFLVDPDGKVIWRDHPAILESALEKAISDSPAKGKSFLAAGSAKAQLSIAEKSFKAKKYEEALDAYRLVAKEYPDSKEGKKAKSQLKKIEKNSSIMGKIRAAQAERKAEKWLAAARSLAQYGDASDAVKYYKRIMKECPGTKSAKYAKSELESIKSKVSDDESDDDGEKSSKKRKKAADEDEDSDDEDDESDDDSSDDE